MDDDQPVCLCFRVSKRKVIQFIKMRRPQAVSQLAECFGAGTGCGWCRPYLQRLYEANQPESVDLPDLQQYSQQREAYRKERDPSGEG
ncbi:bacterioferritin-associated ferredoxin [Stieleria bergensis]|uniref:Bacterioferritin-associated ferredoxin n=1 Tax=Stieleria bergensis TaxID=2528025 RepID=A0A517SVM6_9BACT|nr:MAG: (2Fe-2S)-binding protein [Rhodopirellula sp. TMED11]QDT60182.1 bacterioferritin-associated ferredoxin [Planctomycetes bacterium SV_7m_r]